ncbi:large ribosomal subunit protein uL30m isoform X2 [Pseudophryne corroboree]|uniref:large ribosomal subunit protein uL30m isoform X2 n=1 Tax=Pseudophryne corroboree TaxID=495146 RepID=UPI00308216F4
MALVCCSVVQKRTLGLRVLTKHPALSLVWTGWIRHKFTKSRVLQEAFQPKPEDHEKYGGNPDQAHKLHIVTRIRSFVGRPYWEKEVIDELKLQKAHNPVVHKNIPSVNRRLKVVKHLVSLSHTCLTALNFARTCQPTSEKVLSIEYKQISFKYRVFKKGSAS